jgi:hypothetical protein
MLYDMKINFSKHLFFGFRKGKIVINCPNKSKISYDIVYYTISKIKYIIINYDNNRHHLSMSVMTGEYTLYNIILYHAEMSTLKIWFDWTYNPTS